MHADDDIQVLRHPRQIARLMERLHAERGQITLVADEGRKEKVANVLEADLEKGALIVDAFEGAEAVVFDRANDVHVKTVIEGIQSWFSVPALARLHDRGDHYYHLPFPEVLYRLQRRAAFRARLPGNISTKAHVQAANGARTLRGTIHDISTTGICFRFPREEAGAFVLGTVFESAYVSCDCGVNFHVQVAVCNVRAEGDKTILVGMRFVDLTPSAERVVDRAVQDLQREMMALT